jgi:hypothetical protein
MQRWVPLLIAFSVIPQRTAKVVLREEQLLGGPEIPRGEDAIMAHQGFELPPELLSLNPVCRPLAMSFLLLQGGAPAGPTNHVSAI